MIVVQADDQVALGVGERQLTEEAGAVHGAGAE
jgi:hypothetical protein